MEVAEVKEQENKTVQSTKVASLGKVDRVSFSVPNKEDISDTPIENKTVDKKVSDKTEGTASSDKDDTKDSFTEEQRKALLKELFGDENFDVEAAKEKLKPAAPEPTEEEKKKAQSENEIRLLKLWVDNGGTPEQYNELKNIATGDKVELSKKKAIGELMAEGFTKEEAEAMMKQEFYQIELDNIEQNDDETDEEFESRKKALQKKVEYGAKKLERYSSYEQKQAADILKGLSTAIESKDLEAKKEAAISSNVDELLSKYPRKQTIELGKNNEVAIAPVEHEVSEESIKQVAAILKDPAKRNNYFKNQDGSLNLQKLTETLLNSIEYNRAVKNALLEGQTRMTAEFRKTFPASNPYELGIGGAIRKNTGKGSVASSGKPQRVSPQHN